MYVLCIYMYIQSVDMYEPVNHMYINGIYIIVFVYTQYIQCIYMFKLCTYMYLLILTERYILQVRRSRAYLDSLSMDGAEVQSCSQLFVLSPLLCNVLVPRQ